jgi:1,4-alpha-glucan branching enzyme
MLDGASSAGRTTTFEQVESKLGYIKELGFTCVEPLPVQEYAMDRACTWRSTGPTGSGST